MSYSAFGANSQAVTITSLKCTFCNMDKPLDAFSKTQVMKATYNPHAPPSYNAQKKHISCKKCTLGSVKSMRCMTCAKHMPLEQFAKSQRKHADRARCLKCMKKREEEDVWCSEPDSDDSDDNNKGKWDDFL
ncbi:uncharacterized protein BX664DRAFT_338620 [Halteromyces radiatus]|uniref:uncharacterized protein n=1 Tax=Halteromyces radiatus TaxID=101107 RepID=UPI00221E4783|nr:uncharacterized protein BX664DRAFT_338620 [Halteromyces radiatus]KAI8085143.1 hypothetical protein BX664DRAFT_338620 [Halteromyces radiatus]